MPLTIDFDKILADLEAAGKELYESNDEEVKTTAIEYKDERVDRMLNVANKYAAGEIDEQFVLDRLNDEKDLLLSEAESFAVKALKVAEKASNAGIEILTKAITDILGQIGEDKKS